MNRHTLARNLADSLTLGAWSKEMITACLLRRLPFDLHHLAKQLAGELSLMSPAPYAPASKIVANTLLGIDAFEKIFLFCLKRDIWPSPDLTSPAMAPIFAFNELDLPQLPTVRQLADWLMITVVRLEYLADVTFRYEEHGETAINHYHYTVEKKKSRGVRVIEAPKPALKGIQRQILRGILDKVPLHVDAFGFVKGRNCIQAAQQHVGEQTVMCFDLKDFFPSIAAARVFGLFRCLGYPNEVARCLTGLCTSATPPRILERLACADRTTYYAPHLPQGAPTSPALANHVAFGLDRRLAGLARHLDCYYSRYADDLTFSGDRRIVDALAVAVPEIVRDEGYVLNRAKTRTMSRGVRQIVTGVVVNRHLNVDRKFFDHLKAVIHACSKPGDHRLSDPNFRALLLGQIAWVEAVNPKRGSKLRHLLAAAAGTGLGEER